MYGSRVEFDRSSGAADREIIGPSTQRYAIVFFPPAAGRVYLSTEVMTGPDQGIALSAGQTPLRLCIDDHGDAVQRGWHAVYIAASTAASWIQVIGG